MLIKTEEYERIMDGLTVEVGKARNLVHHIEKESGERLLEVNKNYPKELADYIERTQYGAMTILEILEKIDNLLIDMDRTNVKYTEKTDELVQFQKYCESLEAKRKKKK